MLDHSLEKQGSVWRLWGKGECLLNWFRLKSGHYSKYTPAEAVALQLQSKKLQVSNEHSFLDLQEGAAGELASDCTEAGVNSNNCH